jgi:hypothetical protein
LGSAGTLRFTRGYFLVQTEEDSMKKFGYIIAALASIAIAAPSIANAETIVIRHGGMHHGWHHEGWHRDHGWHHHHDRMMMIRHGHHRGM